MAAPVTERDATAPAVATPDGGSGEAALRCIGIVVHPSRNIDRPLERLRGWAGEHGVDVVQVPVSGQDRIVAAAGDFAACDLIVSIIVFFFVMLDMNRFRSRYNPPFWCFYR